MIYAAYGIVIVANVYFILVYRANLLHKYHTRALDYCQAINLLAIINGTYNSSGFGGYEIMVTRNSYLDLFMLHKWTFKQFYPTINQGLNNEQN
jgi:hypothetical protein